MITVNKSRVRGAVQIADFEAVPIDPRDRQNLVELSGQELAPVIEDRGIVLNDSEAILQYLDANYPQTPRPFPATRNERKECEAWNKTIQSRFVPSWLPVFFFGVGIKKSLDPSARDGFHDALQWLESRLEDRDSFNGSDRPICDRSDRKPTGMQQTKP